MLVSIRAGAAHLYAGWNVDAMLTKAVEVGVADVRYDEHCV